MQKNYDVAVIGGGPGGYTAALYCVRSGYSVVVIERLSPGGQMATTSQVENYPGFDEGIDGFDLAQRMKNGAERFGVDTLFADVTSVALEKSPKEIHTTEQVIFARSVVLAMGAAPRELGVPGEQRLRGHGVAYCATCDGMFYRGKTVVVAGGGNSAVADALYLARICKKVYLVHRRDALRASKSYLLPLEQSGVEQLLSTQIEEVMGEEQVTGVRVLEADGNTREIPCEGVFVAIGRMPDTTLCKGQVQLDEQGYLLADESTKTNLPGVFAVGDLRVKPLRQIVTAASDGAVASLFVEEYLG